MSKDKDDAIKFIESELNKNIRHKESIASTIGYLNSLSEKEFEQWCKDVLEDKVHLFLELPNMDENDADQDEALLFCESQGGEPLQRLVEIDPETGDENITPNKYLVLPMMVRRLKQLHKKKISVSKDDKVIDHLTNQPTGESKSSSISFPELNNIMARHGTRAATLELIKVNAGDEAARAHKEKQIEETGNTLLQAS